MRGRPFSGRWHGLADPALAVVLLALLIVLAAVLDPVETRTLGGRAFVHDGDTITVGEESIRFRGIDAPELRQTCRLGSADYACGDRSREALTGLIDGRQVSCSGSKRDRYRRLLADCRAGGLDLGRAQVENGWAVASGDFELQENLARRERRGLWAGAFDHPRDWRVQHGEAADLESVGLQPLWDWVVRLFTPQAEPEALRVKERSDEAV